MQIVFATGQPGQLNFELIAKRDLLPPDAHILATCSGTEVTELLDPITFHAMTRKEFHVLQILTCKARLLETERYRRRPSNLLDKILRRMLSN